MDEIVALHVLVVLRDPRDAVNELLRTAAAVLKRLVPHDYVAGPPLRWRVGVRTLLLRC